MALVVVLLAHCEVGFAEGGFVALDIFFVLSGFLITGLILSEADRTGSISLLRFYARRARRLLPLAVTVLGVTAVLALLLFGPVRATETARDVIAAALYFVNWRFMAEQIDYFAQDDGLVSPVQHYWSLSVEEQFYIVWPILLLGVVWLASRHGRSVRQIAWLVVGPVFAASLAYGIWQTADAPDAAYFTTLGRVWEIMIGAGLALVLPAGIRLAAPIAGTLVVASLVVIFASMLAYGNETPYPGWQALPPTLAAGVVIVAGTSTSLSFPVRALTVAPLQYLGRISYSWYLWHWPAIVFAEEIRGSDLSTPGLLAVTGLAWIPAQISHHVIEERFRHSRSLARRPWRALSIGFAGTAVAIGLALVLTSSQPSVRTLEPEAVAGARTTEPRLQASAVGGIRPDPRNATQDKGTMFDDDCLLDGKSTQPPSGRCVYGDRSSETTVVLFGDSHALQYHPALDVIARQRGWRLVGLARASCPIADVDYQTTCNTWRANMMERIVEREKPALVVASTSTDGRFRVRTDQGKLSRTASQPLLEQGFRRTMLRLRRAGARVAVIRDQARAEVGTSDCILENIERLERCAFTPRRSVARAFDRNGARGIPGVTLIDPMPVLCPGGRCPAVIGDALVYRDSYHLSATFAATLAPWLDARLPRLAGDAAPPAADPGPTPG